jgi:hypothetical protein
MTVITGHVVPPYNDTTYVVLNEADGDTHNGCAARGSKWSAFANHYSTDVADILLVTALGETAHSEQPYGVTMDNGPCCNLSLG